MEIEKIIERLKQKDGLWCSVPTGERLISDASTTLEQLQAENDRLHDELEKVEAERDAAVNDLNILRKRSGWKCYACFYDDHYDRGVCAGCGYNNDNNWQWRGQKED